MKTNQTFKLLAFFSILLMFSCSDDEGSTKDCGVQNFKFMKNGNELVYEFAGLTCIFKDRLKTSFIDAGENVFTSKNECYISTMAESKTEISSVMTAECSGDIYTLDLEGNFTSGNFRYKGDRSLGDTWMHNDDLNVKATYTVVEKDVTVDVPEGTHICDKITYFQEGSINVDTLYFNNSVGFVKYDGLINTYELIEKNF